MWLVILAFAAPISTALWYSKAERDDGVVVRGAKVMIAGVAAANEIFVMPTTGLGEEDKDYAIAFVIPRDAKGITVVEARHPDDARELEGDGYELPATGITLGYCSTTYSCLRTEYLCVASLVMPQERFHISWLRIEL